MRVVDGRGRARWGKVARVDRTSATVTLGDPAPDNEPAFRLALLVPTCRPEAAAWLVEKGTEVGVSAIHFLNIARAPRDFGAGTLDRLRRVAAAAVEQCHRSRLPEITGPHAWKEAVRLAGAGLRWFLDTEADGPSRVGEGLVPSRAGASPAPSRCSWSAPKAASLPRSGRSCWRPAGTRWAWASASCAWRRPPSWAPPCSCCLLPESILQDRPKIDPARPFGLASSSLRSL